MTAMANNIGYTFSTNTHATADPFANATYIPSNVTHSWNGTTTETISLSIGTQINKIDYSLPATTTAMTFNLASGAGSGGAAAGSTYGFTPQNGYSSINEIVGNGGTDLFTPSYSNTILIAGTALNGNAPNIYFYDQATVYSETVVLVGVGFSAGANTGSNGNSIYYNPGAAAEIFDFNNNPYNLSFAQYNILQYQASPAGVVINLDSVSHTFTSMAATTSTPIISVTVPAYTGSNWAGTTTPTSSTSWSTGDYYLPVNGSSVGSVLIYGSSNYNNLVYGDSISPYQPYQSTNGISSDYTFYQGSDTTSVSDYYYGGTGGSVYYMSLGNDVAVGSSIGAASQNVFNARFGNNMFVILNPANDTGTQHTLDSGVSLTYGGRSYTGFAYGYNNYSSSSGTSTTPGNYAYYGLTYISAFECVLGAGGADYIVGDNKGNQINGLGGTNTIILGSGGIIGNIVDGLNGNNVINNSTATGVTISPNNTLSFETTCDAYSGVLAASNNGSLLAEVFLNNTAGNTAQTTFFTGANDQASIEGVNNYVASHQAIMASSVANLGNAVVSGYDTVQSGLIHTLNGSNYSSGTTNTNTVGTIAASTVTDSIFNFDNVYSGAVVIRGHQGNNVFIDNVGASNQAFYEGSASNIMYVTPSEIATLQIYSATSTEDILRVEGWGAGHIASYGNAFDLTSGVDPFTGTLMNATVALGGVVNSGINVLDVRSGTDTVTPATNVITFSTNSATNANAPVFNLSPVDVFYLTGASTTTPTANMTLSLKLDNGDVFTPTGTLSSVTAGSTTTYYNSVATHTTATTIAVDTHTAANYYSDVYSYNYASSLVNTHYVTVNVHYGSG